MSEFLAKLQEELALWEKEGLLPPESVQALRRRYGFEDSPPPTDAGQRIRWVLYLAVFAFLAAFFSFAGSSDALSGGAARVAVLLLASLAAVGAGVVLHRRHRTEGMALLILGGNPAYDAPADAKLADAIAKVPTSIHLSTHLDETGEKTTWHLNRTHPLESWGDVRAEDGTASIIQPLIAPLFNGKSDVEVLELLRGQSRSDYDIVRATWRGDKAEAEFEKAWRRALHDGLWEASAAAPEALTPAPDAVAKAVQAFAGAAKEGMEVTFRPDVHAWDAKANAPRKRRGPTATYRSPMATARTTVRRRPGCKSCCGGFWGVGWPLVPRRRMTDRHCLCAWRGCADWGRPCWAGWSVKGRCLSTCARRRLRCLGRRHRTWRRRDCCRWWARPLARLRWRPGCLPGWRRRCAVDRPAMPEWRRRWRPWRPAMGRRRRFW